MITSKHISPERPQRMTIGTFMMSDNGGLHVIGANLRCSPQKGPLFDHFHIYVQNHKWAKHCSAADNPTEVEEYVWTKLS